MSVSSPLFAATTVVAPGTVATVVAVPTTAPTVVVAVGAAAATVSVPLADLETPPPVPETVKG